MEMLIHFAALPSGKELETVKLEIAQLLDEDGLLLGSGPHHLDLDLLGEEDNKNPKHAILAVKHYLQESGFDRDTAIELGGVSVGIYG